MSTFLIQSSVIQNQVIPEHPFGYTLIDAIRFYNWRMNKDEHTFKLVDGETMTNATNLKDVVTERVYEHDIPIPVGSVEFCMRWFKLIGMGEIKPLNIPPELWQYCKRDIKITYLDEVDGWWMVKDTDKIKADSNQMTYLRIGDTNNGKKYFITQGIETILSEWRVFVYMNLVAGFENYSGNPWILPDSSYIDKIVDVYNKRSYTLDVMVYSSGDDIVTDIVELHDFFSCGLYGFDNYSKLISMHITAFKDLYNAHKL